MSVTYLSERKDEERKNDNYTLDDCVLIRTTNAFPFNHEIHTPSYDRVYDFGWSTYMHYPLLKKIREKYPDTWEEESKKYLTIFYNPRNTIHFTINGLVSSSLYGNFENRPFIIVEPLKYHLDQAVSLRVEDTFFKGNMNLSKESTILIRKDEFEKFKIKYPDSIEEYNIFVFEGSEEDALKQTLMRLGYDSFIVNNHGYVDGLDSNTSSGKMYNFISALAQERNIPQKKHCYTDDYYEEHQILEEESKEIDKKHLLYILDNSVVPTDLKEEIIELLEYNYSPSILEKNIEKIIDIIGLENIEILTKEFNNMIINQEVRRR